MCIRQNRPGEAVLTNTHNLCFVQKYEKYQSFFYLKNQFSEVKFSVYLNSRVFVMGTVFISKLLIANCPISSFIENSND